MSLDNTVDFLHLVGRQRVPVRKQRINNHCEEDQASQYTGDKMNASGEVRYFDTLLGKSGLEHITSRPGKHG